MTSKLEDYKTKIENANELQNYLESFNKEIEDGSQIIQVIQDDENDDEDDEGGTYFVDQSGNYYYQVSKDSEPILTNPPENLDEFEHEEEDEDDEDEKDDDDEEEEAASAMQIRKSKRMYQKNKPKIESIVKTDTNGEEVRYVVLMDDDGDGDKKDDDKEDQVYEFDENEEQTKIKTEDGKQIIKIMKQYSQMHMCNYCSYTSPKRYLLARHMKCHSEERPHKCSVCERGFKTQASLQNHINTHTGNKPHSCKYCKSCFTTSGELVRHVRYRHTHEKPHKCTECDYASVELSKLKRHIRCHTGERPYQCPHCTYASPDTFKLKRHLRIHTGEKPYECDICHARFTQSNSLKAHKLIHSVGDKPVFQCELCPTTCGRKTDLRIHVQKLHTSDTPLKCKRCDKLFPDRYSYKVHSKTHEGEKCYKCELCPYASISARHLESHVLIHTDQKPYECDFCDQAFRQKQLLKRHINLYHNKGYVPPPPREKTHICPHCERTFRHKGNLIRHMALHDPESSAYQEALALKAGRQKRIEYIDGQPVEVMGEEEEPQLLDEDSDMQEVQEETKQDQKNLVAVKSNDGQQYVVLEVIQVGEDGAQLEEQAIQIKDDEYTSILSDLPPEVLNTLRTSRKLRAEPQNVLVEKNMENYFGFDEEEDQHMDEVDEKNHKSTIKLLEIHQ